MSSSGGKKRDRQQKKKEAKKRTDKKEPMYTNVKTSVEFEFGVAALRPQRL